MIGQPLISVVTPLYNGEQYLAECIESVLAQTYARWEYIIVNNHSTDRSGELARRYAHRDPRIRVYDNSACLPAVDNWNHALRLISPHSVYCKVLHADDWLFPDCLQEMARLAQAHPTVGLVSAYRLDENFVNLDGLSYAEPVIMGRELCRRSLLQDRDYFGSPTSVLVRSEIVRARHPFYTETTPDTDTAACFDMLRQWDFGFVHQVLTFTRRHNESRSSALLLYEGRHLAKLRRMMRYGPLFLEPAEFETRRREQLEIYYRVLARGAFELQPPEFWRYQADGLRQMGLSFSRRRLAAAMVIEALDLRQTWRHVRRGLARRQTRIARAGARPAPWTEAAPRPRTNGIA